MSAKIVSKKRVLLCCTGSVATIKLPILVRQLQETVVNIDVQVIVTEHAKHFYNQGDVSEVIIHTDQDEWATWKSRGDPVLHIELSKWADILVIAPLDANTLGKISNGICDNLLTCTVRAWDVKKPLLFCPAMNTRMWEHPITSQQISVLQSWGYSLVPCISKTLICGDTGLGAMAEVDKIVDAIKEKL